MVKFKKKTLRAAICPFKATFGANLISFWAIFKKVSNCHPARAQLGEEAGFALHRRRRPQGEARHLCPEARERLSGDKIGICGPTL